MTDTFHTSLDRAAAKVLGEDLPTFSPVLTADEFMAKHASKLLASPEWEGRGLLPPEHEHTYEAHDDEGNTTSLAVVLDEEGDR